MHCCGRSKKHFNDSHVEQQHQKHHQAKESRALVYEFAPPPPTATDSQQQQQQQQQQRQVRTLKDIIRSPLHPAFVPPSQRRQQSDVGGDSVSFYAQLARHFRDIAARRAFHRQLVAAQRRANSTRQVDAAGFFSIEISPSLSQMLLCQRVAPLATLSASLDAAAVFGSSAVYHLGMSLHRGSLRLFISAENTQISTSQQQQHQCSAATKSEFAHSLHSFDPAQPSSSAAAAEATATAQQRVRFFDLSTFFRETDLFGATSFGDGAEVLKNLQRAVKLLAESVGANAGAVEAHAQQDHEDVRVTFTCCECRQREATTTFLGRHKYATSSRRVAGGFCSSHRHHFICSGCLTKRLEQHVARITTTTTTAATTVHDASIGEESRSAASMLCCRACAAQAATFSVIDPIDAWGLGNGNESTLSAATVCSDFDDDIADEDDVVSLAAEDGGDPHRAAGSNEAAASLHHPYTLQQCVKEIRRNVLPEKCPQCGLSPLPNIFRQEFSESIVASTFTSELSCPRCSAQICPLCFSRTVASSSFCQRHHIMTQLLKAKKSELFNFDERALVIAEKLLIFLEVATPDPASRQAQDLLRILRPELTLLGVYPLPAPWTLHREAPALMSDTGSEFDTLLPPPPLLRKDTAAPASMSHLAGAGAPPPPPLNVVPSSVWDELVQTTDHSAKHPQRPTVPNVAVVIPHDNDDDDDFFSSIKPSSASSATPSCAPAPLLQQSSTWEL